MKLGDSLSSSIDKGLAGSRYGIVVLSKAFITKPWPQRELEGLVARQMDGRSTILPVWHQLTREDVLEFSPPLANKIAAKTADTTADEIALQILSVIRPDIAGNTPYDELRKIATGQAVAGLEDEINRLRHDFEEFQCSPKPMTSRSMDTSPDDRCSSLARYINPMSRTATAISSSACFALA